MQRPGCVRARMLTCAMRQLGGHVAGHVDGQQDDCDRALWRLEHQLDGGNALQPAAAAVQQRIHNGAGYHSAHHCDVHLERMATMDIFFMPQRSIVLMARTAAVSDSVLAVGMTCSAAQHMRVCTDRHFPECCICHSA